jgi:hypothetical protein
LNRERELSYDRHLPMKPTRRRSNHSLLDLGPVRVRALAVGAHGLGALAIGTLALGTLAIGAL